MTRNHRSVVLEIVEGTLNILVRKLEAVREDLSHPLEEPLSGRMDVIKPKPEHDVPLKYLLVLNTGR